MPFVLFILERDRTVMFQQYYSFPEKRLVNHLIHSANVKNLDDCVLFCYLNDCCVSLNFKKNAEYGEIGYICEVNNATHLEYEFDLITDKIFIITVRRWVITQILKRAFSIFLGKL